MKDNLKTLVTMLLDRDFDPDLIFEVIVYPMRKDKPAGILRDLIVLALMSFDEKDFNLRFREYSKGGIYDCTRMQTN